jgi:chromosome segregation ATPase
MSIAAKESESLREDGRRKFEACLERCRNAEAELKRAKTLNTLAARDSHKEMTELQKQTLIISLQYEKQCKAMERLRASNDDAQAAIQAARAVQARETSVVERDLERAKSENEQLMKQLNTVKKQLKTEVRCRAEVSGQLKGAREDMQAMQRRLGSEEVKRTETERKLKQSVQVIRKLRKAYQENQEVRITSMYRKMKLYLLTNYFSLCRLLKGCRLTAEMEPLRPVSIRIR